MFIWFNLSTICSTISTNCIRWFDWCNKAFYGTRLEARAFGTLSSWVHSARTLHAIDVTVNSIKCGGWCPSFRLTLSVKRLLLAVRPLWRIKKAVGSELISCSTWNYDRHSKICRCKSDQIGPAHCPPSIIQPPYCLGRHIAVRGVADGDDGCASQVESHALSMHGLSLWWIEDGAACILSELITRHCWRLYWNRKPTTPSWLHASSLHLLCDRQRLRGSKHNDELKLFVTEITS